MTQTQLCKSLWLDISEDVLGNVSYMELRFKNMNLFELLHHADLCVDHLLYGARIPSGNAFMEVVDSDLSLAEKLQILRFAKRFTPHEPVGDMVPFLENNTRLSRFPWNEHSTLVRDVCEAMRYLVKDYHSIRRKGALTNGSYLEKESPSGMTKAAKLLQMERFDPLYLYPVLGSIKEPSQGIPSYSNAVLVPKNYKTPRIVCVEPEARNVLASPIASAINCCLPNWCNYLHQERNGWLAKIGSIDGSIDTIDFSMASDCVSYRLCEMAFKDDCPELWEDLCAVTSRSIKVDNPLYGELHVDGYYESGLPRLRFDFRKKLKVRSHMMSTMGNRVTYPLECIVFMAVVDVANHYCGISTDVFDLPVNKYGCVGDDLCVPHEITETLLHIGEVVGLIPNRTKTFTGTNPYRESCGYEFCSGEDTRTYYWPRREVTIGKDGLPELIALQHKLVHFPKANCRMVQLISRILPDITESCIGSDYDDLWAKYPRIEYGRSPYRGDAPDVDEGEEECEFHHVFITQYTNCREPMLIEAAERLAYYESLKLGPLRQSDLSGCWYNVPRSAARYAGLPISRITKKKFLK